MYLPPHFAAERASLIALIQTHPLGVLIRHHEDALDADHLPFLIEERGDTLHLLAHVARANPLWQQSDGSPVLVIFRGAEGYVSPNWYPGKAEHHRAVPTWNYAVAHAHGRLRVHDDARFVQRLLARLTREHEEAMPRPWRMGDAPRDYLEQMLAAVVGIEVEVERLEGKFKLSQNRDTADRAGVVTGLASQNNAALAEAVAASKKP